MAAVPKLPPAREGREFLHTESCPVGEKERCWRCGEMYRLLECQYKVEGCDDRCDCSGHLMNHPLETFKQHIIMRDEAGQEYSENSKRVGYEDMRVGWSGSLETVFPGTIGEWEKWHLYLNIGQAVNRGTDWGHRGFDSLDSFNDLRYWRAPWEGREWDSGIVRFLGNWEAGDFLVNAYQETMTARNEAMKGKGKGRVMLI